MKNEIKRFLIDVCGSIVFILVIFFFFTLWLYSYNDIEDALKNSWDVSISFFSAIATLGAAVIAAKLFNNWKESQTGINRSELSKKILSDMIELKEYCDYHYEHTRMEIIFYSNNDEISAEDLAALKKYYIERRFEFISEYERISKCLILNIRTYEYAFNIELIHQMETKLFHGYKTLIIIIYGMLSERKPKDEILYFHKTQMKEEKDRFKVEYFEKIIKETKKYVNLTDIS